MSSSSDKTHTTVILDAKYNKSLELYKMKIIRVGTYHVLPIPKRVQAESLREHRARCRPHLIKHTTSVLDAKYIKSMEL